MDGGDRTDRRGGMGESTRRPASAGGAASAHRPPNDGGGSKNWQYRPVVSKRETLPPTQMPAADEGDVPALWSTNVWGDVRRGRTSAAAATAAAAAAVKRPRSGGSSITVGAGLGPGDDVMTAVAGKESEIKKKLAAFASFNQTERDLLQTAFARVGQEHGGIPGLATRSEFTNVFDRLGVRLSPVEVTAMFGKYGEDRTGRMPVDLFVTAVLESNNRIIAMEERRVGAYKAGKRDDYAFNGRIKYFPCRKGVYAPTVWDPALAARSAKPPRAGLSLDFVYGYGGLTNTANNLFYNSADHVCYYTAAVAVVFDRHNHRQHFFHGHDDDIKCMALHPNMHWAATGQVTSTSGHPFACVWDTRVRPDGSVRGRLAQLPFPGAVSVIALAFSSDGDRLTVVTGDVDHTVHVFDWAKADAALNAGGPVGGQSGLGPAAADSIPHEVGTSPGLITIGKGGKGDSFPHVLGAVWNPFGKCSDGGLDSGVKHEWAEFVTYGAKHVKLWRLFHAKQGGQPYYGKLGSPGAAEPGKFSPTMSPVDVMSACWLPPRGAHAAGAPVLATGTREGDVLLWTTDKGLCCTRRLDAHGRGPTIPALSGGGATYSGVRCLSLRADSETMVSGGGDGVVMWWSAAALTAAARTPSAAATPHERHVLTGDDNARPPAVRGLDCHKFSSDVMVGTYRCEVWEIDDVDGPQVLIYGHSGDVRGLAVHPLETHVFATASEAGRLFVWNSKSRVLRAKCNVMHPCVGVGFSPDGQHIAVGCKDGTLVIISYPNLVAGAARQVVTRPDGTRCEFRHCAEAVDEVRYSPDGHLLAAGSHDNFIDIYDVSGRAVPGRSTGAIYHRLHRLRGHSSYITHLDWSALNPRFPHRRVLQSTCGAYELLYWDGNTGQQVRQSMRDERWDTQTCTLGFSVMGIWPKSKAGEKAADGTDINACDRGPAPGDAEAGELLAVVDDSGMVKLFNWPCVVEHAPFRRMEWPEGGAGGGGRKLSGESLGYVGHSSHVVNVRFANRGRLLISVGGHDRAVFQWRVDAEAVEQKGTTKRRAEPKPYIMAEPKTKAPLARLQEMAEEEEAKATATAMSKAMAGAARQQRVAAAAAENVECEYVVTVVTGDAKGASTQASVTFSASGVLADGRTTVINQTRLDNAPNNFERGRTDVFKIRAADLGVLKHARVGHDNGGHNAGWLLQSVSVLNRTKGWEHTMFPQKVWLERSEAGNQTQITLYPTAAAAAAAGGGSDAAGGVGAIVENKRYVIKVTTADAKGSGTDANVWIELVGEGGRSSGQRKLDNAMNNFERARVDRFEVEAAIGPVARARIGHDNSGMGAAWCLAGVSVTPEGGKEVTLDVATSGIWLEDGGAMGTATDLFLLGPNGKAKSQTVTYKVEIHTSDVKFAGTDANVSIDIIGAKGTSGKRKLATSRNNFERNAWDVFFIQLPDLGKLTAINIGHDNSGFGAAWHLDKVLISDESNVSQVSVFPAGANGAPGGRWFDKSSGDGLTTATLVPANEALGTYYTIEVQTSDLKFSGTDANVSITLVGEKDGKETRSAPNLALSNSKNNFERAELDRFEVGPVPDLGQLTSVDIGHDGTGMGSGWHCEYVEVSSLTRPDERWYFPVHSWFDLSEEPRQRRQTIKVAKRDPSAATTTYKIEVNTSDVKNAGTDANVHIVVFGVGGNTGKVRLSNSKNNFERATEDSFSVTKLANVGAISHVVVGHDDAYISPSWHLAQVRVFNMATGESLTFPADCWIAKDEAPHFASEIMLMPAGVGAAMLCTYQISVRTSDVRFAGTDANVACRLFGTRDDGTEASTGEKRLENSKNNFERNKEDVFTVKDMDVGELTKLFIGHDGSGMGSDWHLGYVEVKNLDAPQRPPRFFYHDGWLSNERQQGVMLTPEGAGGASAKARYRVVVHTSDKRFAGTDAAVTCKLTGELDGVAVESEMMTLENSANNFERGMVDEFVVQTRNMGVLTGVDIGMDGGGLGADWHLKLVAVASVADGRETFFYHDNWLRKGSLCATLKAALPGEGGKHQYVVEVLTSDIKGSGTDANMSIVVFGGKGDTGEHKLDNSANNFERGMKDVFHLEGVDVGAIERIRIGHDNSGTFFGGASWHCASVGVTNTTTGVRETFSVNKWFATDKPPKQISQVLYPGNAVPDTSTYVITVHTSDVKGAGTDANVTLELHGMMEGKEITMGPFPLETSADDFKRGAADVFTVEGPKLGDVVRAVVAHDGKGLLGGADWHLQMINVADSSTTKETSFWCDAWIAKNAPKTMELSSAAGASASHGRHRYKITVRTSEARGSGTDANVWMVVYGAKGDTGERKLDTSANNFERGMEDVFMIEAPDLGEMLRVLVGHDNAGFGPGWLLGDVTVEDISAAVDAPDSHRKRLFSGDVWLDKSKAPYQTQAELLPSDGLQRARPTTAKYTVTVHTSDMKNSGTDATVWVELSGDGGKMGWTQLPDGVGNPFQRGEVDVFEIEGSDVGTPEKLGVKHDDKGYGPAWHLALVEVRHNGTGTTTMFPCDNWLSKETALERMLLAGTGEEGRELTDGQRRYCVSVVTSNKSYAGTDAAVFIAVKGPRGEFTRRLEDKTVFGKRFEKGQEDAFTFIDVDVADVNPVDNTWPIDQVTLGLKAESVLQRVTGTDWHVFSVKVADVTTGAEVVLACEDWVKEKVPQTWRRADGAKQSGLRLAEESGDDGDFQYRLDIVTGNRLSAGTDATVSVAIMGQGGERWVPMLQQNNDHFAKGRTDSFVVSRGDDLGEIATVTLTCDNGGMFGDSWYCEKVTVAALASGRVWVFHCGKWVGKEGVVLADKVLEAAGFEAQAAAAAAAAAAADRGDAEGGTAAAAAGGPSEYRLTFFTGNKMGSGTDATVVIELIGAGGITSGDLTMDREPALFENKSVDTFTRAVDTDLGDLSEVLVWHDGKGGGMLGSMMSGWFLEKVRVEHALTERTWEADFGEWIYGKREKGLTKKLTVTHAGLDAEALRLKARAAAASVEGLNALRVASPRKGGAEDDAAAASAAAAAAAAAASAAAATAAAEGGASSSRSDGGTREPPARAVAVDPGHTLSMGRYEVSIKPTEKTTSAVDGCPVPLQIRIMGRAGKVELTVEPGTAAAHTQNGGFIIASVSSQAIGDMVQVCLIAGSPMAVGQQFEVDTLTVHTLLPEAKPHAMTFAVHSALDAAHPELRVRTGATRGEPVEEWEEAVARKDGVSRKYWFSKTRSVSVWREPLKYFPVRFTQRPSATEQVAGGTPGQTPSTN